ncbi:hypothetical protein Pogu_2120 [Pyrobaculum oguniense TE7]|uniref:Uncharacterized protein n=1 Tax=Pyrobaculum oguniense (strain DSM 13380 / JCM 10595 / TE7) TaxID=698757 RepID=H6QCV1_PYROT|nr:hypothetical protein Pogu_2120 [Pyrobaculum oguniense TE7]
MASVKFDDIPRLIIEGRQEARAAVVERLGREVRQARRPWGPVEPFVEALYHTAFVKGDSEVGLLLYEYLSGIYAKYPHAGEAREIMAIVLEGAAAKLGLSHVEDAVENIKSMRTSSVYSELVKALVLAELGHRGGLKAALDKVLAFEAEKAEELRKALSNPEAVEAFHLYYDLGIAAEPPYSYYIKRAHELLDKS